MSGCRVFIGHLSPRARERDVEKFFKGYGHIREINLKNGFGFVVSATDSSASSSVRFLPVSLKGLTRFCVHRSLMTTEMPTTPCTSWMAKNCVVKGKWFSLFLFFFYPHWTPLPPTTHPHSRILLCNMLYCCVHPSGSQSSTLALGEVEVAAPVWDVLEVAAAAAVVAAFARPVALDLGTSRWNLHINHHRNRINSVTSWFFFYVSEANLCTNAELKIVVHELYERFLSCWGLSFFCCFRFGRTDMALLCGRTTDSLWRISPHGSAGR